MNTASPSPLAKRRTRSPRPCRGFITRLGAAILVLSAIPLRAVSPSAATAHGGRVRWARMQTSDSHWDFHADRDPSLARFIEQETTLNLDRTWHVVSPARIDDLCEYPFIYVKNLAYIRRGDQQRNVAEYLRRGGFLCIDACFTPPRTPDMDVYYEQNRAILEQMAPGGVLRPLPETESLYHCYFDVKQNDLNVYGGPCTLRTKRGMFGYFKDGRVLAVLSMNGLECGWPESSRQSPCMKMIVNVYVYAITQAEGK